MDENDEPHTNREYRHYQARYQGATRCRLRPQWIEDDYANIESSDDEDTSYDLATRAGMQMEAAPILDRVVMSTLIPSFKYEDSYVFRDLELIGNT